MLIVFHVVYHSNSVQIWSSRQVINLFNAIDVNLR